MKTAVALATLLVLFGCASSNHADQTSASTRDLQIDLQQVGVMPNVYYFAGPVNVQYQLSVTNPTNETYKLRRLDMRTAGPGAYSLRTPSSPFNVTIPPGQTVTVNLSAWGRSSGSYLSAEEPVTIQGTAYFEGPKGAFVRVFQKMLSQFGQ